ncbi:MAG: adenylate/guanylate cyclase domain-containing protein, partial [Ardenticatenales bacterium]
MNCVACGFANPTNARFCAGCGQPLVLRCPQCDTELAGGARFCFQCGAPVNASPSPPAAPEPAPAPPPAGVEPGAERRMVTILFADIVGSTVLGERFDPEDLADWMGQALGEMTRAVEAAGGTVGRLMGDGMLAFFGAPISHEDDPLRAVRAALAIRGGVAALSERLAAGGGPALQVRVGLNSGLVVVGQVGGDVFSEYTTMGDAANTAARMQGAAGPDEVFVSAATAELLRHAVDLEFVGDLSLKGKAQPVAAYRVTGDAPALGASTRGLTGRTTDLIGRDAELQRIVALYEDAVGASRLVWVTLVGDAGIGKSRLTQAFLDGLGDVDAPPTVLRARAIEQSADAYSLVRDLLLHHYVAALAETTGLADRRGLLAAAIAADLATVPRIDAQRAARDLAALVLSDADGRDPRGLAERARGAFSAWLGVLSNRGPLLVVLEDLHWADDASLDTIERIADDLANRPIVLLGNAREALFVRRPHWGEGEAAHRRVDLGRLTAVALEELIGALLGDGDVPPAVRDFVIERGEGNPYYVEEVVHMLLVRGIVARGADGGWTVDEAALDGGEVPTTLAGMLQAHLDALTQAQKTLLQRAAIFGREFWLGGVAALGVEDATDIEALRRSGLVFARGRSSFAGEREFVFKHALLRDAAYASLLKRQRPSLHGAAADWLRSAAGDRYPELAAQIGDHCRDAERPLAAAVHYAAAGDRERQAYANASAVGYYGRAIEAWDRTSDAIPATERTGAAGVPEGMDASRARFEARRGHELALDPLAERDAQRADLDAMALLASGMDATAVSYVHFRRSWLAQRVGDAAAAATEARAALEAAGEDRHARADALVNLGNAL